MEKQKKSQKSNPYENLYLIWQVLRNHASKEKPLTAGKIHEILKKNYESYPAERTVFTLLQERKGIISDIFPHSILPGETTVRDILRKQVESSTLIEDTVKINCMAIKDGKYYDYHDVYDEKVEEAGTEELSNAKSINRYYYLQSPLEESEWKLLSDLLQFSPWISQKQTTRFMNILHQFGGIKPQNTQSMYSFKREHEGIFKVIHVIHQGISEGRKVTIRYGTHVLEEQNRVLTPKLQEREGKGAMTIVPLALLSANGFYYVVAQHGDAGTMHLRVDRIISAYLAQETFETPKSFNSTELRDRSPVMYGGQATLIRFTFPSFLLNTVMDFFGTLPKYSKKEEDRIEASVQATLEGTKLFALQYINQVEVLYPPELRQEITQILEDNLKKYQ